MDYDRDKVDDAVLALLWLTASKDDGGASAWKGHDWDAMNRLYEKGLISNPRTNAKSVHLTEEGWAESQRLFAELFGAGPLDTAKDKPKTFREAPKMPKPAEDKVREERIDMEIVVDAYDEVERAMGWYCYMENQLTFPFKAVCRAARAISPLKPVREVQVTGMAPSEECENELFVTIRWKGDELAIPLAQLQPVRADEATREAVEDWLYWVDRGYRY